MNRICTYQPYPGARTEKTGDPGIRAFGVYNAVVATRQGRIGIIQLPRWSAVLQQPGAVFVQGIRGSGR